MKKSKYSTIICVGVTVSLLFMFYLSQCSASKSGSVTTENGSEGKTSETTTNVIVDGSVKYQSINGFEMTILGMKDNPDKFGEALPTIGQQLVDDFGFRSFKIREHMRDFEPANDNADPLSFNWNYYNLIFSQPGFVKWFQNVKAIHDAGGQIHLSSFQPPGWMVEQGPYKHPREWQLKRGYPRPALYQEIAELWAALLVHLRDVYGVNVEYCVIWNEPLWGEPLLFTESELVETLKAMGQRFSVEGLNTEILVPDGGNIANTLRGSRRILMDSAASSYAGAIAYHPYDKGRIEPDLEVGLLQDLSGDAVIAASGLELYMTEWAPTGKDHLRGQALVWAKEIYNCHVFGRTSLISNWYIGPLTWSSDPSNSIADNGSGGLLWRKKMYAFKQFAGFIDQGSRRIYVSPTVSSGTSTPAVSAYLHATTGHLVIVAVNRDPAGKEINVLLRNLSGYGKLDVYRTSATENTAFIGNYSTFGNTFTYTLPKESITTFTAVNK